VARRSKNRERDEETDEVYREPTEADERRWADFVDDMVGHEATAKPARTELERIAHRYVATLRERATDVIQASTDKVREATRTPNDEPLSEVKGAFYLYETAIRDVWGPLLIGFLDWVFSTLEPDQVPVFLLRDAGAMFYLAQQPGNRPFGRAAEKLYLSRPLLGVRDEWTGSYDWTGNPQHVYQYLGRHGFENGHTRQLVLVDTGAYGSLIKRLAEPPFGIQVQARFLFSHNPYIPGWLNTLGVPEQLGEIMMDSIEFLFPQKYQKPVALEKRSLTGERVPKPILARASSYSCYLYEATGRALENAQRPKAYRGGPVTNCETDEGFRAVENLIGRIAKLQWRAQMTGQWTGILDRATPASQKRQEFLDSYPAALQGLNPRHLLPAHYLGRENRRVVDLRKLGL
jgi:hypothetical protein